MFTTVAALVSKMPYLSIYSTNQTENYFYNQVAAIVANGSNYTTKCEKCLAATNVFHEAAISQPVSVITDMLIRVCRVSSDIPLRPFPLTDLAKGTLLDSLSMQSRANPSSLVSAASDHTGPSCKTTATDNES